MSGRNDGLDPKTQYHEIYRNLALYEFPWDIKQSLSFALFRTYAVPSIGALLAKTGEFDARPQQRYEDTVILLEAPVEHGFASEEGRTAIRRINQMHRSYDISNDDMRYVLATFVVTPVRWIRDFGWRQLTEVEEEAIFRYFRELGKHMAIKEMPDSYEGFATLLDTYEAENFAFDPGGRSIADATMTLLASFYPKPARPAIDLFSRAMMDEPLLKAFRLKDPGHRARAGVRGALKVRARVVALLPPRRKPCLAAQGHDIRSYPGGWDLAAIGTFPGGCPVPHDKAAKAQSPQAPIVAADSVEHSANPSSSTHSHEPAAVNPVGGEPVQEGHHV